MLQTIRRTKKAGFEREEGKGSHRNYRHPKTMQSDIKKNRSQTQSKNPSNKAQARDYPATIAWSDEDDCFVARVPLLDGCMSHGNTMAEAAENIIDAAEGWLAVARKHGDHIPPPPKAASGKIVLRMPKDVHARSIDRAAGEGVSLNTWIITAVAEKLGAPPAPARHNPAARPR